MVLCRMRLSYYICKSINTATSYVKTKVRIDNVLLSLYDRIYFEKNLLSPDKYLNIYNNFTNPDGIFIKHFRRFFFKYRQFMSYNKLMAAIFFYHN